MQNTKKLDCPVTFQVKKLYRFPEFQIKKDTNWQRSSMSKKIKENLQRWKDLSTLSPPSIGHLEYLTRFPKGMTLFIFINY